MQESLRSFEEIQRLFDRYITEKTLSAFSKLLDKNSSHGRNTYNMTKWISKNFNAEEYEDKITSIYLNCKGDIKLGILFLIDWKNSVKIDKKLICSTDFTQELKKSSLLEIGNILTGSFFNTVSEKTDYHLISSIPLYAVESFAMVAEILQMDFAEITDEVIINEVELTGNDSDVLIKMIIAMDLKDVRGLR